MAARSRVSREPLGHVRRRLEAEERAPPSNAGVAGDSGVAGDAGGAGEGPPRIAAA